ncbi:UNVERIFIED_CONTAM: hypothetical protein K2H54_003025, partial [Gekko kuhli]
RRQQQQQQEVQELMRHLSQGEAGHGAAHLPQKLSERQSLSLPYQNTDTYHHPHHHQHHHHTSPQHLLKVRAHECIPQVPSSVPPHGYAPQPALVHSESMEEEEAEEEEAADCVCEGDRDAFPDHKTKGCHESSLLLGIGGPGDPESVLGTAEHERELGTHLYGHHQAAAAAAFSQNKVPYRDPMVTSGMERHSPGEAVEMSAVDGPGAYTARPVSGAPHRSRPLQRHHTIQNSDDAYVQLDTLAGMSLMAGKALSSARMSDAVLGQSPLHDGENAECEEEETLEGEEHAGLGDGSQHLNASCYPSTCITDVLLSYKHPEVPFGMEQAGV